MYLSNFLKRLRSPQRTKRRRGAPVIERLESRRMLTTIHVDTTADELSDNGQTSLREAVIQAHEFGGGTVQITLATNATYELTRPTILTNFTSSELLGLATDRLHGDLDINRNLIINGRGSTIDANELGRIFEITGGVNVTLNDLTIRDGLAPFLGPGQDQGGGIRIDNDGGAVTINDSVITSNEVLTGTRGVDGVTARGGGIYVEGGTLHLFDSAVTLNVAQGGDGLPDSDGGRGGSAYGGGIYAEDADVTIERRSNVEDNDARGGRGGDAALDGGHGGTAHGGGIYVFNGSLTIDDSRFTENEASGGDGGDAFGENGGHGGSARGGDIYVSSYINLSGTTASYQNQSIVITDTQFSSSDARAGEGGDSEGESLSEGSGGDGGEAQGGSIYAGDRLITSIEASTFTENDARGGRGGRGSDGEQAGEGGRAQGGAVYSRGQLDVVASTFETNAAIGRSASFRPDSQSNVGGDAFGGAIHSGWDSQFFDGILNPFPFVTTSVGELEAQSDATPALNVIDSDFDANRAQAGDGGHSDRGDSAEQATGGHGYGGGIYIGSKILAARVESGTFTGNEAAGGEGASRFESGTAGHGGNGRGGAIRSGADTLNVVDVQFAENIARGGNGGNTREGRAGNGGDGRGGAIEAVRGTVQIVGEIESNVFDDPSAVDFSAASVTAGLVSNQAFGGIGGHKLKTEFGNSSQDRAGDGGSARGGAISKSGSGRLTVEEVLLVNNTAVVGYGGHGNVFQQDVCGTNDDRLCAGSAAGNDGIAFGGAVFSSSDLTIDGSSFVSNIAAGVGVLNGSRSGAGAGGISRFGNGQRGGDGGSVLGGAVAVQNADVTVVDTGFLSNSAIGGVGAPGGIGVGLGGLGLGGSGSGGRGGDGGGAAGGAIGVQIDSDQDIVVRGSLLSSNTVVGGIGGIGGFGAVAGLINGEQLSNGGNGGNGGFAAGGGLSVFQTDARYLGDVSVRESVVSGNRVVGGDGGNSGSGGVGSLFEFSEEGDPDDPTAFETVGGNGGTGGEGGRAEGGGIRIRNANADIIDSTIDTNIVSSGYGGDAGHGGSGLPPSTVSEQGVPLGTSSILSGFGGDGGNGGDGGVAQGGGLALQGGAYTITRSTIANNVVIAGGGGNGGNGAPGELQGGDGGDGGDAGDARGGGISHIGPEYDLTIQGVTVANNSVNAGDGGFRGFAGARTENSSGEWETALDRVFAVHVDENGHAFPSTSTVVFSSAAESADPSLVNLGVLSGEVANGLSTDARALIVDSAVLAGGGLGAPSGAAVGIAIVAAANIHASLAAAATFNGAGASGLLGTAAPSVTAGGTSVLGGVGVSVGAGVGFFAVVFVSVAINTSIGLAEGKTFQEALGGALGDTDPSYGPNLGVLLGGSGGNGEYKIPVQGPGSRGQRGSAGIAEGAGIFVVTPVLGTDALNSTSVQRSLIAGNETRQRTTSRRQVPKTSIDANGNEVESSIFFNYEVTQTVTTIARDEINDGPFLSNGTNLIGIADSRFEGDLRGTSDNPLDPLLSTLFTHDGGSTPTLALLPGSPALDAVSISTPDVSQNGIQWTTTADIGAWGGGHADDDGVPDHVENRSSNSGDGNNDSTTDRQQDHVVSLNDLTGGAFTLVTEETSPLQNIFTIRGADYESLPESVRLPHGLPNYDVTNVNGSTTVTVFVPEDSFVNTFYNFGPTPDNAEPHWYEFLYDGTTGAEIFEDRIVVHLVDGARGDSDLTVNGTITDPGTPAISNRVELSVSSNQGLEPILPEETEIIVTATTVVPVKGDQFVDVDVTGEGVGRFDYLLFGDGSSTDGVQIRIPDGETTGSVRFVVLKDGIIEPLEIATLTMSNPSSGIALGATTSQDIEIIDRDAELTVTIVDSSISEGDGISATTATVTRNSDTSQPLTITLTSSDTGEATVPATIVIPAGSATSAPFSINAIDDVLLDGTQTVSIKADAAGHEVGAATIEVLDNDTAPAPTLEHVSFYDRDSLLEQNLSPDGTGQRSIIRHVQVVLDGTVDITPGPVSDGMFTVTNSGTGSHVGLNVDSVSQGGEKTTIHLSFTSGANANGLTDGNYELLINGGTKFDAAGSGSVGGTSTVNFHRLYGDSDGDRDVDGHDFVNLIRGFYGNTALRSVFDRDDDGDLFEEINDFFANFGKRLTPF